MADLLRLLAALVIGGIIGGEREYRGKAAGFRTMTLICLGSAVFTMLSLKLGGPGGQDRIAANIVTGIGFLGAGAIFKEGMTVSGLTTATSIWVTAALGMAAGMGELALAVVGLVFALIVLIAFEWLQAFIDRLRQRRSYRVQFPSARLSQREVDKMLERFPVTFALRRVVHESGNVSCWYDVWGRDRVLMELSDFLVNSPDMRAVEYSVHGRYDSEAAEST
jgi:putative Mg2+ transporter-C (MgtC) family protein